MLQINTVIETCIITYNFIIIYNVKHNTYRFSDKEHFSQDICEKYTETYLMSRVILLYNSTFVYDYTIIIHSTDKIAQKKKQKIF